MLNDLQTTGERLLQEWQQAVGEAAAEWCNDAEWQRAARMVLGGSEFVAQSCQRQPKLLLELAAGGELQRPLTSSACVERLRQALAEVSDESALHHTLRCFRRAQMVRIIWRDLSGWAALEETLEALSALADGCIDEALTLLYRWAVEQQGTPRNGQGEAQQLVVLGMGKLGARELNLSSDIDLIFTFPEQGTVDGRRPQANELFFTRLCQRLVKALGSQTGDGFVFRVDTRLRPFGEAGPLALSFDAMESYYHSQAREWERYAMVKARVVAGDRQHGRELMAMLRPFVYRRYLDFGAIESLRKMKALIARELHRKGMEANVKLGPGGIREVEFIGQAFQLVRGGRDPELQVRSIQEVLRRLGAKGLLPEFAVRELTAAYRYLRLVENRIQAWQDKQSHLLPEDSAGRLRLAQSMGHATWESFSKELERHRRRVQGHFDQVFAAPQADAEGGEAQRRLVDLWHAEADDEESLVQLQQLGFHQPAAVLQQLTTFRESHHCRALGNRGRERMDELMPLLLQAIAPLERGELVLERLLRLLEQITRRTAYLALLVEYPLALSQLVRLGAASPWIIKRLAQLPLLLDELLDPRRLYSPLQKKGLERELDQLLTSVDPADVEHQMDRLRQFAHGNSLRVAAADITQAIPVMVVSDYLTWIAESVLERVILQAHQQLQEKHGRPPSGAGCGLAVIGYGKLGGIELGYSSDLDMVFLHDVAPGTSSDGPRPLASEVFYARFGQRIIHLLTTRTSGGQLYEVDMRLRPNGNSGVLVPSLESFAIYQHESAWRWEHQALIRARAVAGDPEVIARFEQIRRTILAQQRDPEELRTQVVEMREKMRSSLDGSREGLFDLKQGRGGIVDIEFMVQYAVLRWAFDHPQLLRWSDNIRLLEELAAARLLGGRLAEELADAYRALRTAYHRATLAEQEGPVAAEQLQEERQRVVEIWRQVMGVRE